MKPQVLIAGILSRGLNNSEYLKCDNLKNLLFETYDKENIKLIHCDDGSKSHPFFSIIYFPNRSQKTIIILLLIFAMLPTTLTLMFINDFLPPPTDDIEIQLKWLASVMVKGLPIMLLYLICIIPLMYFVNRKIKPLCRDLQKRSDKYLRNFPIDLPWVLIFKTKMNSVGLSKPSKNFNYMKKLERDLGFLFATLIASWPLYWPVSVISTITLTDVFMTIKSEYLENYYEIFWYSLAQANLYVIISITIIMQFGIAIFAYQCIKDKNKEKNEQSFDYSLNTLSLDILDMYSTELFTNNKSIIRNIIIILGILNQIAYILGIVFLFTLILDPDFFMFWLPESTLSNLNTIYLVLIISLIIGLIPQSYLLISNIYNKWRLIINSYKPNDDINNSFNIIIHNYYNFNKNKLNTGIKIELLFCNNCLPMIINKGIIRTKKFQIIIDENIYKSLSNIELDFLIAHEVQHAKQPESAWIKLFSLLPTYFGNGFISILQDQEMNELSATYRAISNLKFLNRNPKQLHKIISHLEFKIWIHSIRIASQNKSIVVDHLMKLNEHINYFKIVRNAKRLLLYWNSINYNEVSPTTLFFNYSTFEEQIEKLFTSKPRKPIIEIEL